MKIKKVIQEQKLLKVWLDIEEMLEKLQDLKF